MFILSWAGMRGVVSLAAAFALPPDFPKRDLIVFLTFCVIAATLVGQGLTLPWLIRHLGVRAPAGQNGEEVHARLAAVEAALLLVAQREAVIRLRDAGVINDETLRAIERDLDLGALRAGA